MHKKALVVHSGGMDSCICLKLAIQSFGKENVTALSFRYGQRHAEELAQAEKIAKFFDVNRIEVPLDFMKSITKSALIGSGIDIKHEPGKLPSTHVTARNGLMAWIAAIAAKELGASVIYLGVMAREGSFSGYPDCNREYFDTLEKLLRLDLEDPSFHIETPLVDMTKMETMETAKELGVLDFLLKETITCYEGIAESGCMKCPACLLRNEGLLQFHEKHPEWNPPYPVLEAFQAGT